MPPSNTAPPRCTLALVLALPLLLPTHGLAQASQANQTNQANQADETPDAACAALAHLHLPHTTITLAQTVRTGSLTPPAATTALTSLPPFCRVAASLSPSADSDIRLELWLPLTAWNHRFNGTGNGGFAGLINYAGLASSLRRGYAVANTDMGLALPPGQTPTIFIGRPERWRDWGYRSTHEMTVFARAVVAAFYGQPPVHTYFTGCSTGGEQALMEAQRFPADYDGIVAGAPANNRTGVHISILWNYAALERNPSAFLPAPQRAALSASVLAACPTRPDGLLLDPLHCTPNPASLSCATVPANPACLSAPQLQAAQALYAGPADPRTHQPLYPGLLPGSEPAWAKIANTPTPGEPQVAPFAAIFQWIFGASWDWRTFDFDRDADTMTRQLAPILNATSPDLDAFRARGGKLLAYHGSQDWLVPTRESILYHDQVLARDQNLQRESSTRQSLHLEPLDSSFRLFLIPEMQHCAAPFPTATDTLGALVNWVEHGTPPASLLETLTPVDAPPRETLLCPFPSIAQYRGTGDPARAASYTCSTLTPAR